MSYRRLALSVPLLLLACAADKSSGDDDDDGGADGDIGVGGGSGPLALLLVVDTSASMNEEAGALARALPALDAARGDRELRVAVTTASVLSGEGGTPGIDPGEAGTLAVPVRTSADPAWTLGLTEDLLCRLTPWQEVALPVDPAFSCDDPGAVPDPITVEYLDCLCGFDAWTGNPPGAGSEEPLEAVLMAGCRASAEPPQTCLDSLSPFAESADQVISGWPGEDVEMAHAIVVSDEGDASRRLATGEDHATPYVDALLSLAVPISVSAVLPPLRDGALPCNDGGATTWGIERLEGAVASTDGVRGDLREPDGAGECQAGDLAGFLEAWVGSR